MSHEGFSTVTQEQAAVAGEAVFHQDGSLNEAFLNDHFGIGVEEAAQQVSFGSYTGTVAQMLGDERCPVGGMVSTAYQEKGIAGVAEKLKALAEMDPNFSVEITEATMERQRVKKK
jgi:hypothetical protein